MPDIDRDLLWVATALKAATFANPGDEMGLEDDQAVNIAKSLIAAVNAECGKPDLACDTKPTLWWNRMTGDLALSHRDGEYWIPLYEHATIRVKPDPVAWVGPDGELCLGGMPAEGYTPLYEPEDE